MTTRPNLPELASFSLSQLAARWNRDEGDVAAYIRTGMLNAHLLASQVPVLYVDISQPKLSIEGVLNGEYRLPLATAVQILDRWAGVDRSRMLGTGDSLELVLKEPDLIVRLVHIRERGLFVLEIDNLVGRDDFRVLLAEVERFESLSMREERGPLRLKEGEKARERCRALAKYIWTKEPELTKPDMVDRVWTIGLDGHKVVRSTVEGWITEFCPNRAPGRRPAPPVNRNK